MKMLLLHNYGIPKSEIRWGCVGQAHRWLGNVICLFPSAGLKTAPWWMSVPLESEGINGRDFLASLGCVFGVCLIFKLLALAGG